jgi:hypothetical protein
MVGRGLCPCLRQTSVDQLVLRGIGSPLPSRLATHDSSLALSGGRERAIWVVMKTEA